MTDEGTPAPDEPPAQVLLALYALFTAVLIAVLIIVGVYI